MCNFILGGGFITKLVDYQYGSMQYKARDDKSRHSFKSPLVHQHWLFGKHLNEILKARLPLGSDTYTLVLRSTEDIRCFQRSAYHRPAIP